MQHADSLLGLPFVSEIGDSIPPKRRVTFNGIHDVVSLTTLQAPLPYNFSRHKGICSEIFKFVIGSLLYSCSHIIPKMYGVCMVCNI